MEEYKGVKFKVIQEPGDISAEDAFAFVELDNSLRKFLHPVKNEGNLSIRAGNGFLVKCTGAKLTECNPRDAVLVTKIIGEEVHAIGGTPSSESMMHYEIYRKRKDANVILHFHSDKLLLKPLGPEVGPFPYGTNELARAVGEAAENNDVIRIREHGLVIVSIDREDLIRKMKELIK